MQYNSNKVVLIHRHITINQFSHFKMIFVFSFDVLSFTHFILPFILAFISEADLINALHILSHVYNCWMWNDCSSWACFTFIFGSSLKNHHLIKYYLYQLAISCCFSTWLRLSFNWISFKYLKLRRILSSIKMFACAEHDLYYWHFSLSKIQYVQDDLFCVTWHKYMCILVRIDWQQFHIMFIL